MRSPARTDCRLRVRFPEYPEAAEPAVWAATGSDGWWALVRNVSATGIGLALDRHFEPGMVLVVELPGGNDGPACPRSARVVHATAEGAGRWLIGCAFVRPLAPRELQSLV